MRWLHQVPLFAPANRPRDICILRLSAIGDTCHTVPLIRALQSAWPECRITWIIGRAESKLMSLVPGVELLPVDKRRFMAELAREGDDPVIGVHNVEARMAQAGGADWASFRLLVP